LATIGLLVGALAACVLLKIWDNLDAIFTGGNLFFLIATVLWYPPDQIHLAYPFDLAEFC